MAHAVNAGARLDRLPISIVSLPDLRGWSAPACFSTATISILPAACWRRRCKTKFSTVPQNLQFISLTFVGMTLGALITGFVGDRFGRRFTYQFNLLIFGLASLAAAFAQDMTS